jgi:hypothetical protein
MRLMQLVERGAGVGGGNDERENVKSIINGNGWF